MVDRILRAAGPVAIALVMVRLTANALTPLRDPDFWWHIRLGHRLLDEGPSGATRNWAPFADAEWVPTQALTEIVFAKAHEGFGLPGIAWLFGVALIVLTVATYAMCRRQAAPLVAALVASFALVGAGGSLSPRPQLVSFVFLVLFMVVWLQTERDLRPRWWLVPVSWVWALSHGMWVLGVTVGACVVLGLALSGRVRGRALVHLAAIPLACLVLAGLTPLGWRLLLGPFIVNERTQYISEWQRTTFLTPSSWVVAAMVVATLVLAFRNRDAMTLPRALLLAQSVGWLFLAGRTVAVAALIVAPLLALMLDRAVERGREPRPVWRGERPLLAVAALFSLVVLSLGVGSAADEPGRVPTGLDAQLAVMPEGSVVFNDDSLGGWLLMEHRHLDPVMDGLFDAYSLEHIAAWADTVAVRPGWDDFLQENHVSAALVPDDARIVDALRRAGWSETGRDRGYVLLRKD